MRWVLALTKALINKQLTINNILTNTARYKLLNAAYTGIILTWNAVVANFKIGFEFLEAWSSGLELGVRDADLTGSSP